MSPTWIYAEGPGALSVIHRAAAKAADVGGTIALFWFIYWFIFAIDFKIKKWVISTDDSIHDMLVPLVSKTVRVFVLVVGGMIGLEPERLDLHMVFPA